MLFYFVGKPIIKKVLYFNGKVSSIFLSLLKVKVLSLESEGVRETGDEQWLHRRVRCTITGQRSTKCLVSCSFRDLSFYYVCSEGYS